MNRTAMDGGVASCRSILDKPLSQLTEEDISQLTREDCRKYLKEKGMRRPSWNKSQAIEQVISLKALLETSDDSGAGVLRKVLVAPPENGQRVTSNSADSVKEHNVSEFGDQNGAYRRKYPAKCAVDTDNKTISTRIPGEANGSVGQMTIFYCGKVNVYDGMPTDKARAIMHFAATPINFSQNALFGGITAFRSSPCHLWATSNRPSHPPPSAMISQLMQTGKIAAYPQEYNREKGSITCDSDIDGQVNRKVSLQRYLEKRKDRGRLFKGRKNTGPPSSGLEVYLNHRVKTCASNGQWSQSSTSCPSQPKLPSTSGSSADYQAKTITHPLDLNNEDA